MLYQTGENIKTVSANTADEFDTKLDKVLNEFKKKGIRYKLEIAPQLGFTVFVRYEESYRVAETIADEFELGGEIHKCIECPFFVRPTDGRQKYTRCEIEPGIHRADSCCCDTFYEKLFAGEINLVEVIGYGESKEKKAVR